MSDERPGGRPPMPVGPPRPRGAPGAAPSGSAPSAAPSGAAAGFGAAAVPPVPAGLPVVPAPSPRREATHLRQGLPPAAAPWSAGPGTGPTPAPATARMRRIAQALPYWEPLPPGEITVRRPGAGT
ncbi:hypothetical protein EES45_16670 [Streptomyces sp. ADI97-07]|uniref:hypothetical protein n=1 Tax=Streptomyces sp. ADI97-07 TaxID=1522762 RepID=UPI000F54FA7D|nr:hypothetical protein [Streptomyces sp. ADI97-07]RPK78705.1 hypothetical protein EES45_16670 [Streptomyces sp. ADI97-07]